MAEPVFVSFFTDNGIYPQLALRLASQIEAMGLKHDIRLKSRELTGCG
ncbi:hypothetical protein Q8V93_003440 [Enterobacter asburiae]|nr:hypothetical protein [Enterobacter asburiae]